jgi:hypothetical protein
MIRTLFALVLMMVVPVLSGATQEKNPHVVLHTQLGEIEMELDAVHAPATTAKFSALCEGRVLYGRIVSSHGDDAEPAG